MNKMQEIVLAIVHLLRDEGRGVKGVRIWGELEKFLGRSLASGEVYSALSYMVGQEVLLREVRGQCKEHVFYTLTQKGRGLTSESFQDTSSDNLQPVFSA